MRKLKRKSKIKELIIMVFKIDVSGLTKQQAEEQIWNLIDVYKFDDDELKKDYNIKQIWLSVKDSETDVKVIYPVAGILDSPDSELTEGLKKILSEIKTKE